MNFTDRELVVILKCRTGVPEELSSKQELP
jgi:hypothetical protein